MIPSRLHTCERRACGTGGRARGFTLVEVITTLVIMSIIAGIASRILFQAFGALNSSSTRIDIHNQLASAMERICTELHTVGITPSSSPATPYITACTASSITFSNGTSSRTIALSGSNLQVTGDAKSNSIVATNMTALTIQTYDGSNAALPASPSAGQIATIRRIQITITATNGGLTETLRSKMYIRSMSLGSGSS